MSAHRLLRIQPPFVIARRRGSNHEGDMNIARRLIDEAAGSRRGCDQKFQTLQGLHPGLEKILQLIGIQARNRQKASMSCSENTILSGKMSLKV